MPHMPRPASIASAPARALLVFLLLACGPLHAQDQPPRPDGADGYPSAEATFDAVFLRSGAAQRAYHENREIAAAIYQLADGSWHSTALVTGTRLRSAIPYHSVPAGALRMSARTPTDNRAFPRIQTTSTASISPRPTEKTRRTTAA